MQKVRMYACIIIWNGVTSYDTIEPFFLFVIIIVPVDIITTWMFVFCQPWL